MKKGSKFITIILIIMIIIVVGIVSYYTFNYFKNKKIDNYAEKLISDFNVNYPTITLAEYENRINQGIINENKEFEEPELYNQTTSFNRTTSTGTRRLQLKE